LKYAYLHEWLTFLYCLTHSMFVYSETFHSGNRSFPTNRTIFKTASKKVQSLLGCSAL
jgi:hypothetical protein